MDNCNCGFGASVPKFGTPGATFIPHVTESADAVELSWTNNRGLPNPDPVKIPKGGSNSSGGNANQGGGLNAAASALLITILRNGVYSTDQSANITALEAALASGDSDAPDVPVDPEKTLASISATYSGGDVPVGTSVLALTGIVVTAHYSDGSTATVTGYTLSGTIADGSNTVTVSYGGKTTTFAVTGVAESGGGDSGEIPEIFYELAEPTVFDGTKSIDTGWNPYSEDTDFTIAAKSVTQAGASTGGATTEAAIASAYMYNNGIYSFSLGIEGNSRIRVAIQQGTNSVQLDGVAGKYIQRIVVTHAKGSDVCNVSIAYKNEGDDFTIKTETFPYAVVANFNSTLKLGYSERKKNYLIGTINEFTIHSREFNTEEIDAYFA